MNKKIIKKKTYDLSGYYNESEAKRQQRIREPYDYEKYKNLYATYFKDLSMEEYLFCHTNGIQWRIERGYDIDPNLCWTEQPNTWGIGTNQNDYDKRRIN